MSLSICTLAACTFNTSTLPFKSGASTIILLSNLPGLKSALSSTSGLLVAASITTPLEVSKPSISDKSWLSVWSLFPNLLSRFAPTASNSSINTIQGAFSCADLKSSLTLDAPTPTNISSKSEPESDINVTFASPATAFASKVLPVPGGPTSKAPFGCLAPILLYFVGL